jgi:hypothetical protein
MSAKCKAGRRLIQNIQRVAGRIFAKLRGQFHALGFAAAELRAGLAEFHVTSKPDIVHRLEHR